MNRNVINELVACLQHHPSNIKIMLYAAQRAPILTSGIDIWHSQISYQILRLNRP